MNIFKEIPVINTKKSRRKPIYLVGFNDAPYVTWYKDANGKHQTCPYYRRWTNMLERVYCPKHRSKYPTYTGCTLEPAWLSFMGFRAWMETQDWQGKELDKDLLVQGNKHYGPTTCLFIPQALNSLLCLSGSSRGAYPLGVALCRPGKGVRFRANCSFYGKSKHLGQFDTPEEAAAAYKKAKLAHIAELASKETDPRIKQALLNLY